MNISEKQIEIWKVLAKRECWGDEGCPSANFGGNYDDAYYGGVDDGMSYVAREILAILGIDWK